MRFFDTTCKFQYDWEHVTKANWNKYPNELTTHVEAVDILRREVDPKTGVLRTERLITCRQAAPRWLQAVLGGQSVSYVREVSEVDPKNKVLVMRSQNLTFSNILSVYETVTYRPDPTNSGVTLFHQHAEFEAYLAWRKLCHKVEDFSVDRFVQNASLGRKAFESVCDQFKQVSHQLA
ncbi:Protein UPS2, mitochondrial [Wickerhamiella sorbophila]|uniref:Protein UPS2, mitochondrial n=1 Tax=Wickerhamiella sorbophila TaxID=45607 RepID=A0A2T0FLF3_9ASCO|nr:Protein UPS2, mitochondrial [Wickerhamiella sorbophila]PRT55797.1 Protein UPS2, mitochondrial [Wickerhamiella sorbophila]